jgi:DNA-binding MarR family transcriptional regulator
VNDEEPIGLLVAAVRQRTKQLVSTMVREYGLSPQQFWTLVAIARNEGISLRELSERRRIDEPTACRIVNTLGRRRFLRNTPDPTDRRRSRLMLTPTGREMADRLLPVATAVRAAVESSLSARERSMVVAGLQKVVVSMDAWQKKTLKSTPRMDSGTR